MTDLEILEAALAIVHPQTIFARRKLKADDYWPKVALKALDLSRRVNELSGTPELLKAYIQRKIDEAETTSAANHRAQVEAILAGERKPKPIGIDLTKLEITI